MTDAIAGVPSTSSAVEAGIVQGVEAAIPVAVGVAAVSNPSVAAAITAAQALEPAVAALIQMSQAGLMTPAQLDATVTTIKTNAGAIHSAWLASVQAHPGT